MTFTFDLLTQNKWFLGFVVKHFFAVFGDLQRFLRYRAENRQTDRQTHARRCEPYPVTTVGVDKDYELFVLIYSFYFVFLRE